MKIQIDGTNTINKGAELMLYAILDQIAKKDLNASVSFNAVGWSDHRKVRTILSFERRYILSHGRYLASILSKLKLPNRIFTTFYPQKNIDVVLDASGFRLGDQWNHQKDFLENLENYYKKLKTYGTKIILLPQAFGPFYTDSGKKSAEILSKYADLIIARESLSKRYLMEAGVATDKILLYPDFTLSLKGIIPVEYQYLKNYVCVIPNKKILTHTSIKLADYVTFLSSIISDIQIKGRRVFLLNHEGKSDFEICQKINKSLNQQLPVVSGVDCIAIKGIIGSSYLVISSRYHGVASSLNQGVPCLATSWSHKYELLFQDFELNDQIIDLNQAKETAQLKIEEILNPTINNEIRNHLISKNDVLQLTIQKMWEKVWATAEL